MPPPDPTRSLPADEDRPAEPSTGFGPPDPDTRPWSPAPADPPPPTQLDVRPNPDGSTVTTPPGPGLPAVPGYAIAEEVGTGGMGVVYRARQTRLGREVALKMVSGRVEPKELARFRAEAEAMAAVRHPNVAQVFEAGEHAGRPFLAMEFLGGGTLADRLRSGRLDPRAAAEVVGKVARGVQAAHGQQIVHRDLKPSNVLFDAAGEPKVTDFGLAKRGGSDLTATQAVMGTPAYMAPEQASGKAKFVGPQADVWALGIMLYECLSGTRPFRSGDADVLLMLIRTETPDPPRRHRPELPRDLERVCLKCLEKDPADRYPTAKELADDLDRFVNGEPISVRPTGPVEKAYKWARRKPTVAAAYALGALVVLFGTFGASAAWLWRQAEAQRARAEEARNEAVALRQESDAARAAVARVRYARTIDLAHREYLANNRDRAARLLADCDPELRGWEWGYVARLCRPDVLRMEGGSRAHSVSFFPAGDRVVSTHADGVARVWDAHTGGLLRELRGHGKPALEAAVSPDARRVVTAGEDGVLKVWDPETGTELRSLRPAQAAPPPRVPEPSGPEECQNRDPVPLAAPPDGGTPGGINSVVYSPDGKWLAAGGENGVVRVWSADGLAETFAAAAGVGPVNVVRYSPDGKLLAAGGEKGGVRVWEWRGKRPPLELPTVADPVTAITFGSGGRLAVAGRSGVVRVWDTTTGMVEKVIAAQPRAASAASFAPAGDRLATAGLDRVIRLWDAKTGRLLFQLRGPEDEVWDLAFSPDGGRLAGASLDGAVLIWDAARPADGVLIDAGGPVALALSDDGRHLVTAGRDRSAAVWDAKTGGRLHHLLPGGALMTPPPGRAPGRFGVPVRTQRGRPVRPAPAPRMAPRPGTPSALDSRALAVGITPAADRMLIVTPDGRAEIRRVPDGAVIASARPLGGEARAAAVSPDGSLAALGSAVGQVVVWDPRGLPDWVLGADGKPVSVVALGSGSLVVGRSDGSVAVWDVRDRRLIAEARPHASEVWAAAVSPRGGQAASAADHTVVVWDTASATAIQTLRGHEGHVRTLAYSPDGRRLVTGGDDRAVKVWDAATGSELISIDLGDVVTRVAFSADGRAVVAGCVDGTVRTFESSPTDAAEEPR